MAKNVQRKHLHETLNNILFSWYELASVATVIKNYIESLFSIKNGFGEIIYSEADIKMCKLKVY